MTFNVLITGGLGQIGYFLVKSADEFNIDQTIIVDNLSSNKITPQEIKDTDDVKFYKSNILTKENYEEIFEENNINAVIHSAAQISMPFSLNNPIEDAKINILGTLNTLELAKSHDISKFVTIGSAAVIGNTNSFPIKPTVPRNPQSPYGISKATAELYTINYAQLYDLNYNVVRPFNIYSEILDHNDPYSGVIVKFIQRCINNEKMILEGDGNQTRDFIYAEDVAKVIWRTIFSDKKGVVINGATGVETSILNLSKLISKLCNKDWQVKFTEAREGDIPRSFGEKSVFLEEFTSLKIGLKKVIQTYK